MFQKDLLQDANISHKYSQEQNNSSIKNNKRNTESSQPTLYVCNGSLGRTRSSFCNLILLALYAVCSKHGCCLQIQNHRTKSQEAVRKCIYCVCTLPPNHPRLVVPSSCHSTPRSKYVYLILLKKLTEQDTINSFINNPKLNSA